MNIEKVRLMEILEKFETPSFNNSFAQDSEIRSCREMGWIIWMGEINNGQDHMYGTSEPGKEKLQEIRLCCS